MIKKVINHAETLFFYVIYPTLFIWPSRFTAYIAQIEMPRPAKRFTRAEHHQYTWETSNYEVFYSFYIYTSILPFGMISIKNG